MTTPPISPTFQAAKPFEPIRVLQPKPPAPSFATFPTPEWNRWKPATERAAAPQQPVQQAPPANGNNLWSIFNSMWNRNKPPAPAPAPAPAPSLFNNDNLYKPPYARVQPEPMQSRVASSTVEYHNSNNKPFEAQTSAFQLGFNSPPSANYIVSSNTEPGTFQGQLSALSNGEGTSFLYIDGKPYVIRRVINRFSNTYIPGQMNIGRFQPFQRFGPGFIRGAQIPHVVRQALVNSQQQRANVAPINLAGNQRSLMKSPQSLPSAQKTTLQSPQKPAVSTRNSPTAAWQRFNVNKPNYMQIYADYVRSRSRLQPKQKTVQSPLGHGDGRSSINKLQTYYHSPYINPARYAQDTLHSRDQTAPASALRPTIRAGSKYAISIKGIPGSSALAAIRNKAVTNPGFLSDLLSSRSHQFTRPNQAAPQMAPKRNNVMQSKLNVAKSLKTSYPVLANLPVTDRALLRAKVIRPDIWKAQWAGPGRTRANIAYLPRSAFNRLPSWYRPKIGSALVKYVIKAKSTPQASYDIGNKKQSMVRPAVKDVWQKIYSYYNRKNALHIREMQDLARNRQEILARKTMSTPNIAQPVLDSATGTIQPTVNVGSPLLRVRDNQHLKNASIVNMPDSSEGFRLRMNTGLRADPNDMSIKEGTPRSIPPEIWDKRSHVRSFLISKKNTIPHRPTMAGNWGTLKKKRDAIASGMHHYYRAIESPI